MIRKINGKRYRKTELDYRELTDEALAVYGNFDDPGIILLQSIDDNLYYIWRRDYRSPELIGDIDAVNTAIIEWFSEEEV